MAITVVSSAPSVPDTSTALVPSGQATDSADVFSKLLQVNTELAMQNEEMQTVEPSSSTIFPASKTNKTKGTDFDKQENSSLDQKKESEDAEALLESLLALNASSSIRTDLATSRVAQGEIKITKSSDKESTSSDDLELNPETEPKLFAPLPVAIQSNTKLTPTELTIDQDVPIESSPLGETISAKSVRPDRLLELGKNLPVVDTSLPAFADETASTPVAPNVVTSLLTPQEKPHMQSSEAAKVLHVHTPMSPDPKWGKELGQNLLMMVNTKMDVAQMQVNPPNLGPIEVSLRLHQDQASVLFVAATPQAKDTLEQHLPRLAAMLADNGIQLNGAQVSSGDSQERQAAQMAFMQQNQSSRQDESAPKFSVHGMPTAAPVSPPVTPAPAKSVDGDDQLSVYA